LVVMLHGCTQSPDDFAAGTRMNVIAEEVRAPQMPNYKVRYKLQADSGSRCWLCSAQPPVRTSSLWAARAVSARKTYCSHT